MTAPVGPSPVQGALEGLQEGFGAGFGFREQVKGRRRAQQLAADLLTLRQQEGAREQTVFDEQQTAYHKAEALRAEVAAHLSAPTRFKSLGDYVSGKEPGHAGPPLSSDANVAQQVGKTLGEFGGRELTPDQQLLVGSGQVPYGAIAPKAYHPRTRAEWLSNLRIAAGLRGAGTKLPITMDHAFAVLDRIYTVQDQKTGGWVSKLTPGERLRVAKKMVAGNVEPADFPDIKEPAPAAAPAAAPAGGGRNLLQRIGDVFTGGPARPGAAPAAPAGTPVPAPADEGDGENPEASLEAARALIAQYRDIPQEDLEGALRDQGYDEDTIRTLLGSTHP